MGKSPNVLDCRVPPPVQTWYPVPVPTPRNGNWDMGWDSGTCVSTDVLAQVPTSQPRPQCPSTRASPDTNAPTHVPAKMPSNWTLQSCKCEGTESEVHTILLKVKISTTCFKNKYICDVCRKSKSNNTCLRYKHTFCQYASWLRMCRKNMLTTFAHDLLFSWTLLNASFSNMPKQRTLTKTYTVKRQT